MRTPSFVERLISPLTLVWTAAAAGMWYLWPELGVLPLVLALGPWLLRLVLQDRLVYATPYDWALGLFLLTAALSVWAAYDRPTALAKFWPIVAGVLLFYAFSNWQFDDHRAGGRLGWLVALFGAWVSLYFLAVHDWVVYPGKVPALTRLGMALQGPLQGMLPAVDWHRLHPNVVGGILAMTAPFAGMAVWRSWRRRQWPRLAAAVGLLVVVLFGLLMSSSRGAWLALAAATGLVLWWEVLNGPAKGSQTRRRRLFVGSVAGGLALLVILLLAWPGLGERVMATLSAIGGLERAALYQGALTLARDYPFVGGGLDLFQMLHASYVMLLHVGFTVHSHNLYLDVAIEQGLPGLFALLWMWGIFGMVLWQAAKLQKRKAIRSEQPPVVEPVEAPAGAPLVGEPMFEAAVGAVDDHDAPGEEHGSARLRRRSSSQAGVLGAAAMSLTTIALHGLVDDALYGSRAVMLLFLPLAFTATRVAQWRAVARVEEGAFERGKLTSLRRANVIACGGLAAMLALSVLLPATRSYWWSNLAAIRQSRTELAAYEWPEWPIQDELRRELDMGPAVTAYERALAINPANVAANRRLGMIELSMGEYEEALSHLQEAYLRAQGDNATQQLLGEAMIVNGRVTGGAALWHTVNNGQGQLENRRFWYEYIGDAERVAWVEEALAWVEEAPAESGSQ